MHKKLGVILIPVLLNSCGPLAGLAVAGAGAGYIASQNKTIGDNVDETTVWGRIKSKLDADPAKRFKNVGIKVVAKRVELIGHVTTRQARIDAVRLAWEVNHDAKNHLVSEVINDITISQDEKHSAGDILTATKVTSELKTKLLFSDDVKSNNYSFDTIVDSQNISIYAMGVARTKDELNRVTNVINELKNKIAREHKNRKVHVYNHITVEGDYLRR